MVYLYVTLCHWDLCVKTCLQTSGNLSNSLSFHFLPMQDLIVSQTWTGMTRAFFFPRSSLSYTLSSRSPAMCQGFLKFSSSSCGRDSVETSRCTYMEILRDSAQKGDPEVSFLVPQGLYWYSNMWPNIEVLIGAADWLRPRI